jgi:hypothetical protein
LVRPSILFRSSAVESTKSIAPERSSARLCRSFANWNWIQKTRHVDAYRRQLGHVLRKVKLIPLDSATSRLYGEIYCDLTRRGRVLSQVDMMLAAIANQHGLSLLTSDLDFEAVPGLRTEDWTRAVD